MYRAIAAATKLIGPGAGLVFFIDLSAPDIKTILSLIFVRATSFHGVLRVDRTMIMIRRIIATRKYMYRRIIGGETQDVQGGPPNVIASIILVISKHRLNLFCIIDYVYRF